ncbi:MAG: hypothetical protein ACRYG7_16935 [Janthinobacterium lividum]
MKKSFAFLAALALAAATAQAQTAPAVPTPPLNDPSAGRSPEQQAQNQANRLAKELNLSTDQQSKVQQIMNDQRQETQTAIQQAGGNRQAMGKAMRAGRDKFDGQLKAVLTAEQYTKYQQLMAQRLDQLRAHRGQASDTN